jgi:hypothetical protein
VSVIAVTVFAACGDDDDDGASGEPVTVTGAGRASVTDAISRYVGLIGGADNGGAPGEHATGYRTITWDGVPDELAAPNLYVSDFFNAPEAPRARGAVLTTDGDGLVVSADADNATDTVPRFGHLNAGYADIFTPFSEERLFSPVGSNIADLEFFVPGTQEPAVVRGFGAVYLDVDTDHTAFEYFDADGKSLGTYGAPVADGDVSFLGLLFEDPVIHRVRITYGTVDLGPDDGGQNDVAVMDDFIFSEPQPVAG